jgi:hypothetical protein
VTVLAGLFASLAVAAAPAFAARGYSGGLIHAYQYRNGNTVIAGWAYDRAHPRQYLRVCVWSNNKCRKRVVADRIGPRGGHHAFRVVLPRRAVGGHVTLRRMPQARIVGIRRVSTPGRRIVQVARRHLGARYVWGGASPSGFDCSGYAMYSYRHARVASLPHQSNQQRWARHMHHIRRSQARPGDLVFYLSGGSAYHVAIYAGHNAQYSATNPSQGVEYEHIWASNIEFRTDWH